MVRNYYTQGQYEKTNLIYVQQGLFATKEFCQDLTAEMVHYANGMRNMASVYNKTKAKEAPPEMLDERFVSVEGRELTKAFQLYQCMEKRLPKVTITQRVTTLCS
jgi:hypothetical protein